MSIAPAATRTAPGSRGSHATRPPSSRCWVHHHSRMPLIRETTAPRTRPVPNACWIGPWNSRAVSQTRSQATQRQAASRAPAFGRCQARSQVRWRARLQAVAESSVTTTPTTPVLAMVAVSSPLLCTTERIWSSAGPVRPRVPLMVETSCLRIQSGARAPMTKMAGIAPRKACAARRVAQSSRLTRANCSRIRPRNGVYTRIQAGTVKRGGLSRGSDTVTAPSADGARRLRWPSMSRMGQPGTSGTSGWPPHGKRERGRGGSAPTIRAEPLERRNHGDHLPEASGRPARSRSP